MKSRFIKRWCPDCKTMQFGDSCPHGTKSAPAPELVAQVRATREGRGSFRWVERLILPPAVEWTLCNPTVEGLAPP